MKANAGEIPIRDSTDGDMAAVRSIYAHHVQNGLASFEEVAPDPAQIARRRQAVLKGGFPFRVAELRGTVKGYAHAGPYRHRPAYRFSVENSVYVAPDALGLGLGRLLLADLIERCTALGHRQMIAIIGDSGNAASINLHANLGFREVGVIKSAGFKFGRWVDSVIMQRPLGDGDDSPPGDWRR